jgi:daunosaminyl-N,N-dimethyltransferase/N-dimethyltransferase
MDYNQDGFYTQALYYDILFGWDRSEEFLFIDAIFQKAGIEVGQKVCEIACGTGVASLQLNALGWQTMGVDISENMLASMRKKCSDAGRPLPTFCADMRNFKLPQKVEACFCPLGSIGLLHDDNSMVEHLKATADNLNPNGVYLIDLGLNPKGTAPCPIQDIEWGMEIDGIVVEAIDGMVRVNDSKNDVVDQFEWEGTPLEFKWQHFNDLVQRSGAFDVEAFFPEADQTEEGISLFYMGREGFEEDCERAMVLLRKK